MSYNSGGIGPGASVAEPPIPRLVSRRAVGAETRA